MLKLAGITLIMLLITPSLKSMAEESPLYGDACPLCGIYGYCSKQPSHKEIVRAFEAYYGAKQLKIVIEDETGRFKTVAIYKKGNIIDKVLLDLKTGRLRSIQ